MRSVWGKGLPTLREETRSPINRALRARFWRLAAWWAFALLFTGLIALDQAGCLGYRGDDHSRLDRVDGIVERVIDGDTLDVRTNAGRVERVRLIGIDAPEAPRPDQPGAHFARESTEYATARASGRPVLIRLDSGKSRDRHGRLLAYLYLSDSESLNLAMVRDGFAYADRRFPHTYQRQFEQAENEARRKARGLWKDVTVHEMPEWRRRWLAEREK
jgi:micrococcal nuclease